MATTSRQTRFVGSTDDEEIRVYACAIRGGRPSTAAPATYTYEAWAGAIARLWSLRFNGDDPAAFDGTNLH